MSRSNHSTQDDYNLRVINFFAQDFNKILDTHCWNRSYGDKPRASLRSRSLRDEINALPENTFSKYAEYYRRNFIGRFFIWAFNIKGIIKLRYIFKVRELQELLMKTRDLQQLRREIIARDLMAFAGKWSGLRACVDRFHALLVNPALIDLVPVLPPQTPMKAFQDDVNRHLATHTWQSGKVRVITTKSQRSLLSELKSDPVKIAKQANDYKQQWSILRFFKRLFNVGDIKKYLYLAWVGQVRRTVSSETNLAKAPLPMMPVTDEGLSWCIGRLEFSMKTGVVASSPTSPASSGFVETKATHASSFSGHGAATPLTEGLKANLDILRLPYDEHAHSICLSIRVLKQQRDRLVRQYHPDRNRSSDATEVTAKINAAYVLVLQILQQEIHGDQSSSRISAEELREFEEYLKTEIQEQRAFARDMRARIAELDASYDVEFPESTSEISNLRAAIDDLADRVREIAQTRAATASSSLVPQAPIFARDEATDTPTSSLLSPARPHSGSCD